MEAKRWRRPCNQSMAGIWWIKGSTMTDLLIYSCMYTPSFHSFSLSLAVSCSFSDWVIYLLQTSELPHICLHAGPFRSKEGPEAPAHISCKCCSERKISWWRDRGRERDRREGGNMWEGASHMDTGCCQARGREAILPLSLSHEQTLTVTSRSLLRVLSAMMERKVEETLVDFTCIKTEDRC